MRLSTWATCRTLMAAVGSSISTMEGHLAAEHLDRAATRWIVPGNDLDERGLARAVVAHQADDLAGLQGERDVDQCLDGAEMLGDP